MCYILQGTASLKGLLHVGLQDPKHYKVLNVFMHVEKANRNVFHFRAEILKMSGTSVLNRDSIQTRVLWHRESKFPAIQWLFPVDLQMVPIRSDGTDFSASHDTKLSCEKIRTVFILASLLIVHLVPETRY